MELNFVTDLTESRMYRSKQAFKRTNAREVCDMAFMDSIAIWILYNEFEFAPVAMNYAERTAAFNRFTQFRQMGTDLYMNFHVITEKRTDLLESEADAALLDRIYLDTRGVIRYLRMTANNRMTQGLARQSLQRLEQSLYIENSNYRSVRRLAQTWPTLQTSQKRTVLTRMLFYYRTHALRAEMYQHLSALAKSKGLVDPKASEPGVGKTVAAAGAAAAAGFAGGYHLGKSLTK